MVKKKQKKQTLIAGWFLELFSHVLLVTKNITFCVCTFLNFIFQIEYRITAVFTLQTPYGHFDGKWLPHLFFPENEVH